MTQNEGLRFLRPFLVSEEKNEDAEEHWRQFQLRSGRRRFAPLFETDISFSRGNDCRNKGQKRRLKSVCGDREEQRSKNKENCKGDVDQHQSCLEMGQTGYFRYRENVSLGVRRIISGFSSISHICEISFSCRVIQMSKSDTTITAVLTHFSNMSSLSRSAF
jgi:hypothetical protein